MVYLRVPTAVFYIIQAIGISLRLPSVSISAREHFSKVGRQGLTALV
jgi:hypothetical protein